MGFSKNEKQTLSFEVIHKQTVEWMAEKTELTPIALEKYRKKIGDLFGLPVNEQLELISDLSSIKNLPQEIKDLTTHYPYLQTMPNDAIKVIGSYLDNSKDVSALVLTHKRPYSLFQTARLEEQLLLHVVKGNQKKAEAIVAKHPELQLVSGTVTDYSLRTFKQITAYEYAYWAKDTYMRLMLEKYMDADTSADMLKRCEAMDKDGLTYTQNGIEVKGSTHFDFTPLKTRMQKYIDKGGTYLDSDPDAPNEDWLKVGMAQYDVPVHVASEYCRHDRIFAYSRFDGAELPRKSLLYKYGPDKDNVCFYNKGLGRQFAYLRATSHQVENLPHPHPDWVIMDLGAITRLDTRRTLELTKSLDTLRSLAQKNRKLPDIEPAANLCHTAK